MAVVDKELCAKIISMRDKVNLIKHEHQEALATMQATIARALANVGAPVDMSSICLVCGTVTEITNNQQPQQCPTCAAKVVNAA